MLGSHRTTSQGPLCQHVGVLTTGSEDPNKRRRSTDRTPETKGENITTRTDRTSKRNKGIPADSDLDFGCLLCKYAPKTYGAHTGCDRWRSPNIDTVIRVRPFDHARNKSCSNPVKHHVLGTHRKLNKENPLIDDAAFERVANLSIKFTGLDPQQRAEEKWKAAYMALFPDELLIPDPCMFSKQPLDTVK